MNTKPLLFCAMLVVAIAHSAFATTAPTVLVPSVAEPAYQIAGEAFCDMWQKVTGTKPVLAKGGTTGDAPIPTGDVILVGSDAVQPIVHRLILQDKIQSLGIRYGTDDYRILSLTHEGRTLLILGGASGRSTIYAAYDFFRKKAGAEYFWDGDVIPKRSTIDVKGCDFLEQPRFTYRGLRYFAHRGPHRFQAEMWDFEDWKRELDWISKQRLNLFMLRTGIDDLFQRAFPELPYPPEDAVDPDAAPRSYDDRTSFWPLKYRGELRKRVLKYAADRGLIHPGDTGTITHWYSHTPSSFYQKHPDFPVTRDQKTGYSLATAAIWDTEYQRTWDTYWKLTDTHIRHFGVPHLFHMIGMAERRFGGSEREDTQRKLFAYRKIQETLRKHYPDTPLLIASWDLMGWWKNDAVQALLKEFDPQRTILFDYTADLLHRKTYRDWDVIGKFPWIFGVFLSFAADSEMREDFGLLQERIGEAAQDPKCLGLVVWPEISHTHTLFLQYLAANSWHPDHLEVNSLIGPFCASRYPANVAAYMDKIWRPFLPIAGTHQWTHPGEGYRKIDSTMQFDPHFRLLTYPTYVNLTDDRVRDHQEEFERLAGPLRQAPIVLDQLAHLADAGYANDFWRRDAIDITRTIINRGLKASFMRGTVAIEAWRTGHGDEGAVRNMEVISKGLMQQLADLLELSDDFSLYMTVKRLEKAGKLGGVEPRLNSHTEQTLKGNSENNYCRAHQYELVRYVYQPELDEYWKWVNSRLQSAGKEKWKRPASFSASEKSIQERFYATPLAEMAPKRARSAENLSKTIGQIQKLIQTLVTPQP